VNRFLQYFNLLGIAALCLLCCLQWRTNRQLNLQINHLEQTGIEQQTQIDIQAKTIRGQTADLDDFRHRLELSEAALKESHDKFTALAAQRDQLLAERDQLKSALDQWTAAVAQRDAVIKQANEQISKLTADRNDAIAKFNDLANRYNVLVKGPTTRPS
jgi:chromosome segregation ATPase